MKIELRELTLNNFMGAKNQTINFSKNTEIMGQNASGKTRIFNAWNWLLFGKDSEDRKDFNIKTLNANNEPIHRVDYSVSGILSVDARDNKFQRIYREKWIKKRGEEDQEFAGHETVYFINDVPHKASEYQQKVESLMREDLFKLITNPMYFNALGWQARRDLLFEIAGELRDSDVAKANADLNEFLVMLNGKSLKDFKIELAFKKKKLNEELSQIQPRTDEVTRAIQPEPDYKQIQADISKYNTRISEIDALITSDAEKFNKANEENQRKQNRIYELRKQVNELYFLDKSKAENGNLELEAKRLRLTNSIHQLNADNNGFKDRIEVLKSRKSALENENNSYRKDWTTVNESKLTFNENEFVCPACSRPFESDDIEAKKSEMMQQFNNSKIAKLESITNIGKKNAAEIAKINEEITKLALQVTGYSVTIDKYQKEAAEIIITKDPILPDNPQIKILQEEINITEGLIKPIVKTDNSELTKEKSEINDALDELKKALNVKEQNARTRTRITELDAQQKQLSQQIADLEKLEFQYEKFIKAKINMTEERVNGLFSLVKFKLYENLINGGMQEICDALVNGVPYSDVNGAGKIQAGLDIINALSKHYDCYAPVIIDNRESCTEIPEMECQVISLYVDPTCKELKIINQ